MKDSCSGGPTCPHKEEIREIIRETVRETLSSLGIDAQNPIEVQADFISLREWRTSMRTFRKNAILAVIGIVVSGVVAAVWVGIKSFLRT